MFNKKYVVMYDTYVCANFTGIPCGFTEEGEHDGTQWPWQAQIYNSGIYIGEGVILSPRWILTAASVTMYVVL